MSVRALKKSILNGRMQMLLTLSLGHLNTKDNNNTRLVLLNVNLMLLMGKRENHLENKQVVD